MKRIDLSSLPKIPVAFTVGDLVSIKPQYRPSWDHPTWLGTVVFVELVMKVDDKDVLVEHIRYIVDIPCQCGECEGKLSSWNKQEIELA